MMKRRLNYDDRCEDLARYFLPSSGWTEEEVKDLAQDIQDAVESWIDAHASKDKMS